jgi:hypothetical protein
MQPWATGPAEILEHGLTLLQTDSDKNRRLAIIAIDNAVELAIKTYLGLPIRVTGVEISRKDYQEISESFPKLLDALEKHCAERLEGVDLGEVEWYHRLRNQLYHQGNGLTVEREKVRVYSELARILFRGLFGADVSVPDVLSEDLLSPFLAAWVRLERAVARMSTTYRSELTTAGGRLPPPLVAMPALAKSGIIPRDMFRRLELHRAIRNSVVHGEEDPKKVLTRDMVKELDHIATQLETQHPPRRPRGTGNSSE